MKICKRCERARIISISGKTSDCFSATYDGFEMQGYVPSGLNIGGGDYIEMDICLACGQVQGEFPVDHNKVMECLEEA